MKQFYGETLNLGDPVVDSNFWVEFNLPGNAIVALEQSNATISDKIRHGVSWILNVEDFQAVADGLKADGVTIVRPAAQVPGKLCMTFADPEGNPFTLCGVSDNGAAKGTNKKKK